MTEIHSLGEVALQVAPVDATVQVEASTQYEIAEKQLKIEEKQRVLGVIPNFYVTYAAHPDR